MKIQCPFVYSNGRRCSGRIVSVEVYKADLEWEIDEDGGATFTFSPRSHFHLFCSEKGNHAGHRRPDSEKMKCWHDQLPDDLRAALGGARAKP